VLSSSEHAAERAASVSSVPRISFPVEAALVRVELSTELIARESTGPLGAAR
jgi:hypothetical protein